eukprot:3187879-Pleurochrysis_carterae.AAC.2
MDDKYPLSCHPMMSVPINYYRRCDWLDVRRETTLPSRLVAELHRAHLLVPYAVKSRRYCQMGMFDNYCRLLVMAALQLASTNSDVAFLTTGCLL